MSNTKKATKTEKETVRSTLARSDDGTIQITFTVPYKLIDKNRKIAAEELANDVDVPGFRKGKAPLPKLIEKIPQNTLLEATLSKILPQLTTEAIEKHKIKPVIYPKYELVKATDGEPWQIRATTCEIPKITLGDYKQSLALQVKQSLALQVKQSLALQVKQSLALRAKKKISGISQSKKIWTPEKGTGDEEKEHKQTKEEKQQEVIKALLSEVKVVVPKVLIEEEVNSRLSQLLERIEKLGITLESYLASIKKTASQLRGEYEEQSRRSLSLDLILNEIAERENIQVDDAQVEAAIKASSPDEKLTEKLDTPEQRRIIKSVLRRGAVLDSLVSLV